MLSLLRGLQCKICARTEQTIRLASAAQFRSQANDAALLGLDPLKDRFRAAAALWKTDVDRAVGELTPLAEAGSIWSMIYLGCAYRNGRGVPADRAKAELWFRRAFEAGSDNGLIYLGDLYARANQYPKASEILGVGAARNLAEAQWRLAHVMLRASESAPSLAEARRLLERAATQGHLSATRSLVTLLLRGRFGLRGRIEGVKLALDLMRSISTLERPAAESIVSPPAELVFDAPSAAI